MARSVSYAPNSQLIAYQDVSEIKDGYQFDDYLDSLQYQLKHKYQSLRECDKWFSNEDYAMLENDLVWIGASEYCGLMSIWVVPKENNEGLELSWIEQIREGFLNTFSELSRVGVFSNGEAIYEKRRK